MANAQKDEVNGYLKLFKKDLVHKEKKFTSHKNTEKILQRIENKDKKFFKETLKTIDDNHKPKAELIETQLNTNSDLIVPFE